MTRVKKIYTGAFALMIAGLLSKVISAFYRIPLQNLTGDVGFYMYQQLYPLLGIASMLALYGFPAAISRYLAEWPSAKNKQSYRRILCMMIGFCVVIALLILWASPLIAGMMGDEQLIRALRQLGWVFLLVPFVALLRGVTQAGHWMEPTAYSQMVEQLFRACLLIATAILIFYQHLAVHHIATGAIVATGSGLLLAALFLWPFYQRYTRKQIEPRTSLTGHSFRFLGRSIILSGVVISLNHMLLLVMQLADAFTMVPALSAYGFTLEEAREWKGIFDRGQPLVQLVTVLGSSLALALVPQVTSLSWQMDQQGTLEKIRSTIKYAVLLSVGATVGLLLLLPEINQLFFQNQSGTTALRILALAILFSSLAVTLAAILQGFGYMRWTAAILLVGLLLKLVLNDLLITRLGVNGGAVATVVTLAAIALSYDRLLRARIKVDRFRVLPWKQLLLASGVMALLLYTLQLLLPVVDDRFYLFVIVLVKVAAGAAVYVFVLIKTGALNQKEREQLSVRKQK
ncbi:putative polysaccharide biosynthesis protein [Gracilibacillus timonensis]|uniref:putative polysaccharide biosynthesis protein n=1 Tax=Gracilibacillus timonensis TaxID=1816696 RepID=UPI0008241C63|nr:polysaccharide biosynthesis C-terminal domain-containing protein [Gracilibacillus timonensis]